jgi:nitrogen fixation protein FixH
MTQVSHATEPKRRGLTGAHVLFSLLSFFAVIVAADTTLIYKALTTFGGVDNLNAYRDGLAYNARIAADTRQADLGWQDKIEISGDPARLRLSLKAKDGAAVVGQRIVAKVGRPATNRFDNRIALVEASPGVYEAVVEGAESGTWLVEAQVFSGPDARSPVFQARRRVWIAR